MCDHTAPEGQAGNGSDDRPAGLRQRCQGDVAEWLKATVSNTVGEPNSPVGSNPTIPVTRLPQRCPGRRPSRGGEIDYLRPGDRTDEVTGVAFQYMRVRIPPGAS